MQLSFPTSAYDLATVKKAAYKFTDRCSVEFDVSGDSIICSIFPRVPMAPEAVDEFEAAFRNEVLDQDLRRTIARETASLRNAILAHAFSKTGIQGDD